jgi:hypothetical protein
LPEPICGLCVPRGDTVNPETPPRRRALVEVPDQHHGVIDADDVLERHGLRLISFALPRRVA